VGGACCLSGCTAQSAFAHLHPQESWADLLALAPQWVWVSVQGCGWGTAGGAMWLPWPYRSWLGLAAGLSLLSQGSHGGGFCRTL
jgi:hypothetical protein